MYWEQQESEHEQRLGKMGDDNLNFDLLGKPHRGGWGCCTSP